MAAARHRWRWPAHADQAQGESVVSSGRVGTEVMVAQGVPVWRQQLDVSRNTTTEGLGSLLETFASLAGSSGTLAGQLDREAEADTSTRAA